MEKRKYTTEIFIEKANEIHKGKFIYTKTIYEKSNTKVCIICPEHGEFWMTPSNHLLGQGCPKCAREKLSKLFVSNLEEFEKKARKIHGDRYIYTESQYVNAHTPIKIICKEHGEFWQTPHKHINGKHGCPKCKESHLEREIRNVLNDNNIMFQSQKSFDWLLFQRKLYLDFYLPNYNIAIECQGGQHFYSVDRFGGQEMFELSQQRDTTKLQLCQEHGIKLLYFSDKKYVDDIIIDKDVLLEQIRSYE